MTSENTEREPLVAMFQRASDQLACAPVAGRALLQAAFAQWQQAPGRLAWCDTRPDLSRLCAEAFGADIEPDAVKRFIREHELVPEASTSLQWPWAVRVHTLGRFAVCLDNAPLTFSGKSPRKALELLQALIAHGGREVNTAVLMQSLWPEESNSNLRNLFDNTLHRLRRLLGPVDVLRLNNGKLTLSASHCWVDAWVFNRLTAPCSAALSQAGKGPAVLCDEDAQAALRLYSGHFLQSETEEPWSLPYRDRLRNRFHRLVRTLGERLEKDEQWEAAADMYERGLEIDNLSELFYQHLMVCHQHLGEHAEALRVYRRCKELLSIVLGVSPSPRTEKIRQDSQQRAA